MSSFPTRVHLKQWQGFHLNLNSVHPGFRQCEHVWRITALGLLRGLRVWRIVAWPPRRVHLMGFPGGASGKEPVCQCRRYKGQGFSPWVGKIPWSRAWQLAPGNPMDRGAWQATVHGVAKSWTQLKRLSMHAYIYLHRQLSLKKNNMKKLGSSYFLINSE